MIDFQLPLFPRDIGNQDMLDIFRVLKMLEEIQGTGTPVNEVPQNSTAYLYVNALMELRLVTSDGIDRKVTLT